MKDKLNKPTEKFKYGEVIIVSTIRPTHMGSRGLSLNIYKLKVLGSNGLEEFTIKLNQKTEANMIKKIRRGNKIARKFLLDKKF